MYDYVGQEQGQYADYFTSGPFNALTFIVEGRDQIEAAAGGEGSGTVGVDFARLLRQSSYYPEVRALYNEAGLRLRSDLNTLARNANLKPDKAAYRWLARTSVPTGHLQVPELDLHTISDQLVPVQQERYYHTLVARAGDSALLRQAFAQAQGHCNFTPADLDRRPPRTRVPSRHGPLGQRGHCQPTQRGRRRRSLSTLGGGNFIPFWPDRLTGAIPPLPTPSGAPHRG